MTGRDPSLATDTFQTFGELLRYLRKRAHLSQRDLAAQVGYHFSHMSRIENNLHIPDAATLKAHFIPALHLQDQPEWAALLLQLADPLQTPAEPAVRHAPAAGLPTSLTSMLGRERESAQLREILLRADVRLVTIVGPPGVGKTCLALHIAEDLTARFTHGAIFVNLIPITDSDLVLPALADALGIREPAKTSLPESLKATLQNKNLLIVMDNFEQVLEAAPQLIPVLGDAPGVKILATSRESLRVRGEQEFPLAPLRVPEANAPLTEEQLQDYPSVQLFLERARAVKPDFEVKEKTASRVAEICRRLDGLPLAIELAAARVRTLSLSAMLEHFDRRFEWLTRGGRDQSAWRQTLWNAVEWSYALLSVQERVLLNRLSVFAGGWTLSAAEAVCSDDTLCAPSDVLGLLMQLADKSLAVADIEGERYYLLETLREYAHKKLEENGGLERARQSHCDYYLEFALAARPHLTKGGEQAAWLDRMEREHNNLRAALAWAVETPERAASAMELGWAAHVFWLERSYITEARRWLGQILALDPAPSARRAELLRFASDYASMQGDIEGARGFEEEGLAISTTLGDEAGIYYSLDGLAMLAGRQGDYARAAELLEQVLVYRRQNNDAVRLTVTLNNLAIATRRLGNFERAGQLYAEAIEVTKGVGNLKSLGHALYGLAETQADLKEYAGAARLHRESISVRHQLGDMKGLAYSLDGLAISVNHLGNKVLATQLESASEKILRELGVVITPATRADNEKFIGHLRAKLGDAAFDEAWSNGQAMSTDQAVELAMEDALL